jgi:hypothetical protein
MMSESKPKIMIVGGGNESLTRLVRERLGLLENIPLLVAEAPPKIMIDLQPSLNLNLMADSPFHEPKGSTPNKYSPHQGQQEALRRLRKNNG